MSRAELINKLILDLAFDDCWVSVFDAANSVDVAKKLLMACLRRGEWSASVDKKFQEYVAALQELSAEIDSVEASLDKIRREIKEAE